MTKNWTFHTTPAQYSSLYLPSTQKIFFPCLKRLIKITPRPNISHNIKCHNWRIYEKYRLNHLDITALISKYKCRDLMKMSNIYYSLWRKQVSIAQKINIFPVLDLKQIPIDTKIGGSMMGFLWKKRERISATM